MKFKVKTTARPAGYILHSEREQIYFIDIIYIYIYIYILHKQTYTHTYIKTFFVNHVEISILEHREAVLQRCSLKKVFVEISENSQENVCARVSLLIKLQASSLQL